MDDFERRRTTESMQVCASAIGGPPAKRIVLVGDSHIEQLTAALLPHATTQRWQVLTILKGACSFGLGAAPDGQAAACIDWNERALREIRDIRPVPSSPSRRVRSGWG
jgi:SGNH domain (fused to AT3 domains)